MTNEERDLIIRFVQRFGGAQPGGFAGGVGQAAPPPLPPIDQEADALLADLFAHYPEARYRITQMAFVQEHALAEAQNRMQRLEWELQQARQQAQAAPAASPWGQPPQQQQQSRGFFGSLLGGAQRQAPPPPPQYAPPPQPMPPPPPQYAPGYSPGMFQPRGSGFLGSALTTAAGVAGGMVAGNALMNLFSGGHGGMGGGFMPAPSANPWAAPASASPAVDPYDVGGADKGSADASGWTDADPQPAPDPNDWSSQPDADSSGWTDPGGDVPDAGGGSDDWS
jgi:hypothetical protein